VWSVPLLNLKSNQNTQLTVWNSQHKEGQQRLLQQILSTHYLRQKLTVIGILLFTEPELLCTNHVSSQQKHDHHLLQQKQAFAFELTANKKMQECFISTADGCREEKHETMLRGSVWKHIHLFWLNQRRTVVHIWTLDWSHSNHFS